MGSVHEGTEGVRCIQTDGKVGLLRGLEVIGFCEHSLLPTSPTVPPHPPNSAW